MDGRAHLQRDRDLDRESWSRHGRLQGIHARPRHRLPGKPVIQGSADPAYRGDASRHNPEDMLVGALSACHMLWYLHLCSAAGVVVTAYEDAAEGVMQTHPPEGAGEFTRVTLRPRVKITAESDAEKAAHLHVTANANCFVARSVSFPVDHQPTIEKA